MALVPYSGGSGTAMSTLVPFLTGENFITWAIKVEAELDAAGLSEAVVPPEDAALAVIAKKDKPAQAYLLRALADDLLLHVAVKKTAAEIWASLQARFLLDSVPDRLYAAVAGIEQFCDVSTMLFEDVLGRLKAFDERLRQRGHTGGEREEGQLMLTTEQWRARERRCSDARDDDDDGKSMGSSTHGNLRGRCYHCNERGHFKRDCPRRRKGPAAEEHALLADVDVENVSLL
ncbi:retrotransposon protein [Hordeum vulgare]|nr:retrotransposon protein [Hordeum vulgare]